MCGMPPARVISTVSTAFIVATVAGAAQIGAGYALGAFSWLPTVTRSDESAWLASLAWTVFISASSVVIGAVVGNRTLSDVGQGLGQTVGRAVWRGTIALAAALGGLVVALLASAPARAAQRADVFAPRIVASYAVAGVLVGLVMALVAVNALAVGVNVMVTTAWLWVLAGVAAADAYAGGRHAGPVQLGLWQMTPNGPWEHGVYLPGAILGGAAAFLIGISTAWPAARHGANRLWTMLSGAAGPVLALAGYALAAPTIRGVNHELLPAHRVVPIAVAAGLLGSLPVGLIATVRRRSQPIARPVPSPAPAATGTGAAPAATSTPATPAPAAKAEDEKTGSVSAPEAKVAGDAV
jgi:hypothetical protein